MNTLDEGVRLRLFTVRCPGCTRCKDAPISILICRGCPRHVGQTPEGVLCKDL